MSHPAVFTSNVQCLRLAAGQRTVKMRCYRGRLVFNLLLLRHWHFTRYCSDTVEVRWGLKW